MLQDLNLTPEENKTKDFIWDKFCKTEYHVDFFEWLMKNFELKPKNEEIWKSKE